MLRKKITILKVFTIVSIAFSMSIISSFGYINAADRSLGEDSDNISVCDKMDVNVPEGYKAYQTNKNESFIRGDSGTSEDNLTWNYENGTLTISGTGAMSDYTMSETDSWSYTTNSPWSSYSTDIKTVIVNEGVTYVGQAAFAFMANLNSVQLPSTLTGFGEAVFYDDYSLVEITVPDAVKKLSSGLFAGCTGLKTIKMGQLEEIDDYAFQAVRLDEFIIPGSLKTLSSIAFFSGGVASYTVESGNTVYSSKDGIIFNVKGDELLLYPNLKSDESYTVPDKIVKIGNYAFSGTEYLKKVSLGRVKVLGEGAFYLSSISGDFVIPDTVTEAGDFTFEASKIESITFGNGLEETAYRMFEDCPNLKTINFGGLKMVGMRAFSKCDSLTSVTLPDNMTEWGGSAFNSCENLESFYSKGLEVVWYADFAQCYKLKTVVLSSVKKINREAFTNCTSLESITLPETIEYVHYRAFAKTVKVNCLNKELVQFGGNGFHYAEKVSLSGKCDFTKAYEVLDLVNKERKAAGLNELKMDESLLESAMIRAGETSVLFSHTRPNETLCMTINDKMYAENIAYGQNDAEDVMKSWMNSSGHKQNIIDEDYNIIGIGCFYKDNRYYWTQCFGIDSIDSSYAKPADAKGLSLNLEIPRDSFIEAPSSSGIIFSSGDEDYLYKYSAKLDTNTIKVNASANLKVMLINPGNNASITLDSKNITYETMDSKIAGIDKEGKVTGVKGGKTYVYAKGKYYKESDRIIVEGEGFEDGPVAEGTLFEETEQYILKQKDDKDSKGSMYYPLQLSATKTTKSSVTLKWKKVKNADGYVVYGNRCGNKSKYVKLADTVKTTFVNKKLKKGTYYKYIVVAYKGSGEEKCVVSTSKVVHSATTGGKAGNAKKITVKKIKKNKISLKKKKTFSLKTKITKQSKKQTIKKHRALSYESTNQIVATVNSKGKIKAVGKGTCYIYIYHQNGISSRVKVTVK